MTQHRDISSMTPSSRENDDLADDWCPLVRPGPGLRPPAAAGPPWSMERLRNIRQEGKGVTSSSPRGLVRPSIWHSSLLTLVFRYPCSSAESGVYRVAASVTRGETGASDPAPVTCHTLHSCHCDEDSTQYTVANVEGEEEEQQGDGVHLGCPALLPGHHHTRT